MGVFRLVFFSKIVKTHILFRAAQMSTNAQPVPILLLLVDGVNSPKIADCKICTAQVIQAGALQGNINNSIWILIIYII